MVDVQYLQLENIENINGQSSCNSQPSAATGGLMERSLPPLSIPLPIIATMHPRNGFVKHLVRARASEIQGSDFY